MTLPDRDAILALLRESDRQLGRREIGRAFGVRGADRIALKQLLRDMQDEGLLEMGRGRIFHVAGELPKVTSLEIERVEGRRITAIPADWTGDGPPPRIRVRMDQKTNRPGRRPPRQMPRLTVGDRVLARLSRGEQGAEARIIRQEKTGPARAKYELGVVIADEDGHYLLQPIDRRNRQQWPLDHRSNVRAGELVRATVRGQGVRAVAQVEARLGDPLQSGHLSDIAIADKGIPSIFSADVGAEADAAAARALGPREDWTDIPFITIDPIDARDHDDAVCARPDGDGWQLLVAIADVSWYVRPQSAIDREARLRGNSVYFPDQVVPMLPPALSTGACSLKAGEDRAAIIAAIDVDAKGELQGWRFHRAAITVAANISYDDAQRMADGGARPEELPTLKPLVDALWGCWRALRAAREARIPLELDIPEKWLALGEDGKVVAIHNRPRSPATQLIEDMMIAANVAAAGLLEQARSALLYRCHATPDRDRLVTLKDYLATHGLDLALGQVIRPAMFNRVLERAHDRPEYDGIAEAVLRAQMQAYYTPENIGHFGLSLASYAHFTSPIRRYADLVVHRAIVAASRLGEGGLSADAWPLLASLGEHLVMTERRAMEAERDTFDRYIALFMREKQGEVLRARITSVHSFGFFARLQDFAGDGLVPVSALGAERFHFDEAAHALQGMESGTRYQQGQELDLCLAEADVITGTMRLALPEGGAPDGGKRRRLSSDRGPGRNTKDRTQGRISGRSNRQRRSKR